MSVSDGAAKIAFVGTHDAYIMRRDAGRLRRTGTIGPGGWRALAVHLITSLRPERLTAHARFRLRHIFDEPQILLMTREQSLRRMYAGGRPNLWARLLNRVSAWIFSLGVIGHGAVTLETINPKSRTVLTLPLVVARVDGKEYLVSMLGNGARWVRNVRAAGGRATIRAGRARQVILADVPVERRAPILKAYLAQAPGARPHIPVDRSQAIAAFDAIATDFPVFEIHDAG